MYGLDILGVNLLVKSFLNGPFDIIMVFYNLCEIVLKPILILFLGNFMNFNFFWGNFWI